MPHKERKSDAGFLLRRTSRSFSFYRLPKALFVDPRFRGISAEAKILYGLLLDRMSLSVKNGWLDSTGRVYIIFTVEEIMESLACGNKRTTIRIRTNVINDFSYPIGYETSRYLKFYLDPIDPKNRIHEMHILDIALEISDASLFPLHVTCQEQLIEDSHSSGNRRKFWDNTWDTWHDDRYRYKIEENGGVLLLWDTKEAVCTEFRLSGYGLRGFEVYFKGIKVDKQSFHARERICSAMDLYGLDTRQTITLDRESLTREGSQRVKDLYRQYLEVYKKIFLKQIEEKKYQNFGRLDFYTLWLFCSDQQRERIPQSLIEEIKDEVAVVVRGEDSKYLEQSRPIRDIIKNIERQWYIDVDEFRIYDNGRDTYDFPKICAILNNVAEGARPLYIADLELEKMKKAPIGWIS